MIRLRVLGPVELEDSAGRELRSVLAQPKRLALLVYLAAATRGFHRRDTLLALFWPELDEAHGRTALNQAIRFLRKELGHTSTSGVVISRGAEELAIDPASLWCDARAFVEELGSGHHGDALGFYRGDFLEGFFAPNGAGFDEWADRERARLRASAAKAARALAEARENEEHFTTAVASARRAVELSDADERVVRELLELLDRLGDRAGAIRAYEAFTARLAAEFETTPAPETTALVDRIRARTPGNDRSLEAASPSTMRAIDRSMPIALAPPVTADPGTDLDRWRVERELARGGMAIVYLARDSKHNRQVAVKILRPEFLDSDGAARFLQEIQITASFAHPHILPLIDSGASNGMLYLVTPYIGGESLRGRLRREPQLPLSDALRIGAEIAEALDYAHRRGVVHRDIKPENILLADGHALVADFGVARALSSSGMSAQIHDDDPRTIVGSRAYVSPEQAAGDANVGARSDIYSLGCVLYEMVAGELARGDESFRDLRRRRPDIPKPAARIISDCLAQQPARRPASASAVLRALEGTVSGSVLVGRLSNEPGNASGIASSATTWLNRTPTLWAIGAVAVIVLGGSVALLVGSSPPGAAPPRVATLPFRNMTGDPALDPVGDAIIRSIAAGLAELGTVDVIPLGQSDADAAFSVTGSYYRRGDSLEFVTDIADRTRRRALPVPDPVRAPTGDPFAASEVLQHRAMGALGYYTSIFGPDSTPERRPPTYPAYLAFAEGFSAFLQQRWPDAESGFRRAIALDPAYTEAYMLLTRTFANQAGSAFQRGGLLGRFEAADSLSVEMRRAINPLTRADRLVLDYMEGFALGNLDRVVDASVRLAERLPAVNYSIGYHGVLANRPRTAITGLDRLDPDRGWTREWMPYWYQQTAAMHQLGEYEDELRAAQRGRAQFPRAVLMLEVELRARSALGELDGQSTVGLTAIGALRWALELRAHGHTTKSKEVLIGIVDRAKADEMTIPDRIWVIMALLALDRLEEATTMLQPLVRNDSLALDLKGMLGTAYARQGNRATATRISHELASVTENYLHGLPELWRARIAARLGDRDLAVTLLAEAFKQGVMHHPMFPQQRGSFWHTDPDFESLRDYGPYQNLIRPR